MKTSICLSNNPKETVHASACCRIKNLILMEILKGCGSACTMRTNGMRGEWKENKLGKREECNQQRERETDKNNFFFSQQSCFWPGRPDLEAPDRQAWRGSPSGLDCHSHLSTHSPLCLYPAFCVFPFVLLQLSCFCHLLRNVLADCGSSSRKLRPSHSRQTFTNYYS